MGANVSEVLFKDMSFVLPCLKNLSVKECCTGMYNKKRRKNIANMTTFDMPDTSFQVLTFYRDIFIEEYRRSKFYLKLTLDGYQDSRHFVYVTARTGTENALVEVDDDYVLKQDVFNNATWEVLSINCKSIKVIDWKCQGVTLKLTRG